MEWRGRRFAFVWPRPALVMGVVNVTPDSFSDGGCHATPEAAILHGLRLAAEGAEILDVGGESTRPGAVAVSETEELRRVLPVIEALASRSGRPVSIDTRKPVVARAALAAGAAIVNDIEARRTDTRMWGVVSEAEAGYIAMHMQGDPATMQDDPVYGDVVREVGSFFADRLNRLAAAGVPRENVALDPGFGFGKTVEHNLDLLAHLDAFSVHARPLVAGISRKSFLGRLTGAAVRDRLPAGLACGLWAFGKGCRVFRAHEAGAWAQALRAYEAAEKRSGSR